MNKVSKTLRFWDLQTCLLHVKTTEHAAIHCHWLPTSSSVVMQQQCTAECILFLLRWEMGLISAVITGSGTDKLPPSLYLYMTSFHLIVLDHMKFCLVSTYSETHFKMILVEKFECLRKSKIQYQNFAISLTYTLLPFSYTSYIKGFIIYKTQKVYNGTHFSPFKCVLHIRILRNFPRFPFV